MATVAIKNENATALNLHPPVYRICYSLLGGKDTAAVAIIKNATAYLTLSLVRPQSRQLFFWFANQPKLVCRFYKTPVSFSQ
jgi:hypothetical protein